MIAENLKHDVPIEENGQTANVIAPDNTKAKGFKGKRKMADKGVQNVKDKRERKTTQMISALPLKLPRIPKIARKNVAEDHLLNALTPNFE